MYTNIFKVKNLEEFKEFIGKVDLDEGGCPELKIETEGVSFSGETNIWGYPEENCSGDDIEYSYDEFEKMLADMVITDVVVYEHNPDTGEEYTTIIKPSA